MISSLKGEVTFIGKNFLELAVGGVGYKVYVGSRLLHRAKLGDQAALYTHLQVKEDGLDLFGVESHAELEFFYNLISVSGVGPKSALHVLELGSLDDIKQAVATSDVNFLTKVSGIGRKTAERIVVELKDKLSLGGVKGAAASAGGALMGDIIEALVNMGYNAPEVREAIRRLDTKEKNTTEIIKAALKVLQKQ